MKPDWRLQGVDWRLKGTHCGFVQEQPIGDKSQSFGHPGFPRDLEERFYPRMQKRFAATHPEIVGVQDLGQGSKIALELLE